MHSLEGLIMKGIDLGRDRMVGDKLSSLTSLKVLDLSSSELTEIPQGSVV